MRILKSSIFLALSTLVKLLLGIVSIKVIIYYLGSSGLGQLGQFMSLMSLIATTAAGGISNGIISKISSQKEDGLAIKKILSAGFVVGVFFSIFLGLTLLFFSNQISFILFKSIKYSLIIKILSLFQIFNVFNVLYAGYLNGLQKSFLFSLITVISSFLGTIGLAVLIYFGKLYGAMLGLIWMSVTPGLLFSIILTVKYYQGNRFILFSLVNKQEVHSLLKYSTMLIVSSCLMPLLQVLVRNILFEKTNDWTDVGFFQATLKLSESGLIVLNVIMVNYFLPELGKCINITEVKKIINNTYLILVPVLFIYVMFIRIFSNVLIRILFDDTFLIIKDFIVIQALGDAFKILSLVFGFLIVLKEEIKIYVIFEMIIFSMIVLLSLFLIPKYGVIGANYAYTISYIVFFSLGRIYLRTYLKTYKC